MIHVAERLKLTKYTFNVECRVNRLIHEFHDPLTYLLTS
jgi:hypothetical protein